MTQRLPVPGSDDNTWGDLLNGFLGVAHNSDGSLQTGIVTTTQIADGTITMTDISSTAGITKTQLASSVQTSLSSADSALQSVPSATSSTIGGVELTGDLGGTATAPTVPTKLSLTGGTLSGNLAISAVSPNITVKNTNTTQYYGSGMLLVNNASGMGNQAGALFYSGVADTGASKGYLSVDKVDLNGANNSHLIFFDYDANMATFYTAITMNATKITNLATPTSPTDAVTKAYVDGKAGGITRSVNQVTQATSAAAVTLTDYVYFWTGSTAYALTMPSMSGNTNLYTLKNASTISQTVNAGTSQTIEGGTAITIRPNNSVDLVADGTSNWMVL